MDLMCILLSAFLCCLSVSLVDAEVFLLNNMFGSLQSPDFPNPYPKEREIQWNISVPYGYQIRLYFMHFDVEPSYLCEYDYVKVYSETEELAVFCGRESTDTERIPADEVIFSPGNMLSLAFRSDFSNEEHYSGFEAHYSAVDIDECRDRNDEDLACDHFCHNYIGGYYCSCRYGYQLYSDNRTCKVECSNSVYTERSGQFTSADFPKPYPKSSDCLYRIELEKGLLVTLDFDDSFDIEDHPEVTCPYDHIKILTGAKEFGPFCGDRSPGRILTESNIVNIMFHSDNSGENMGWKVTYTAAGSECPIPVMPPNGQLEPIQSQYFFKEHITLTCDTGYTLLKDGRHFEHFQVECQADGTWSSGLPICESMYTCDKGGLWVRDDGTTLPLCQLDKNKNPGSTTHTKFESQLPGPTARTKHECGAASQRFPSQLKRIVGGRTATAGLFPWQVLLSVEDVSRVPEGRWFGSGALLSSSWVLTAAHVLRSQRRDTSIIPVSPEHVCVTLGITDIREKQLSINRSVERLVLHPQFNPQNYDNDIALVRLSQDVALNELVRPVCLPPPWVRGQSLSPLPHTLGVVAGWGINTGNASMSESVLNSNPGIVSEVLQYVKLPVVEQEECEASYASRSVDYNITENMFCAGFYEGGRDTCLGDSGGAFVIEDTKSGRWVAQGLVSWGGPEECGSQRVYGVYTRIANYAHWVHTHIDTER
ncbi:mannan-binding lectin serine protease 1 isoform X2 [Hoplias malabaricus]|uniref:mannan-binding lectin serine protease 1 isoform X2 n=1 Tax=Hoplias malabaricus TaxID=27720 RepID=UPI003462B901